MAAPEAKVKKLNFYSFEDIDFDVNFNAALNVLVKNNVTLGRFWGLMKDFEKTRPHVKDEILKWI